MKRWYLLPFILNSFLLFAQSPKTPLTVKVVDPSEAVLSGSEIVVVRQAYIESQGVRLPIEKTGCTSNSNGECTFNLADGIYDVFVSEGTCDPAARRMKVEEGKPKTLRIKMKFSRYTKFIT